MRDYAHRGVSPREVPPWRPATHPVGKSDDSNSQFASQISLVVFGGREAVRRTEGVFPASLSSLPRLDIILPSNIDPKTRAASKLQFPDSQTLSTNAYPR